MATLALAHPVAAHAFLVKTSPAQGERLGTSPANLQLQFSEPVAQQSLITLRSAAGAHLALGPVRALQGGYVAETDVPPLSAGVYLVSWQVVALDGHFSVGEFAFGVGSGGGPLPAASSEAGIANPWPTGLHLIFVLGLLTGFGVLLAERLLAVPADGPFRSPVGWLLALGLVGAMGQLGWQIVNESGPLTVAVVLRQRSLVLGGVEVLAVGYGLWLLALPGTRRLAVLPLGLAVVAASLAGHPGSFDPPWAAIANVAHLGAISLWLGGLVYLALLATRRRGLLAAGLARYTRIALVASLAAVLTGLVVALGELASPLDLVQSWYGRVLDLKVLVVGTALVLALAARRRTGRVSTKLAAGGVSRLIHSEAAVLLVAVAVASVMANLPAPRSLGTASNLLGAPLPQDGSYQATLAGNLAVYLIAAPGQLQLRVLTPDGIGADGTKIGIVGRAPDGRDFSFFPRGCGPGCVSTGFDWPSGITTISVQASAPRWTGGTATLDMQWPPPPTGEAALDNVLTTMRSQPKVDFDEHVTSGPGASASSTASMTGEQFVAQGDIWGWRRDRDSSAGNRERPSADHPLHRRLFDLVLA